MNRTEATHLLDSTIAEYEMLGFRGVLMRPSQNAREFVAPTGCEYQVEVDVLRHSRDPRAVDVVVSIDDMGWRAFFPLEPIPTTGASRGLQPARSREGALLGYALMQDGSHRFRRFGSSSGASSARRAEGPGTRTLHPVFFEPRPPTADRR